MNVTREQWDKFVVALKKFGVWLDDWHAKTVGDKINTVIVIALIALGLMFVAVFALLMS